MSYNKIDKFPKENNLEWLRLIFALQVVIVHAVEHLTVNFQTPSFINNFPGVPAFFFVSGFLIYSSYLNAPGKKYFLNRFLRLFPGLFIVTIGGIFVILYAQGFNNLENNVSTFIVWFFSQLTIGQTYNPELFRNVGVGVINGSLWTITVEIIFYFCVPLIVWLESRFRFIVFILIGVSGTIYMVGPLLFIDHVYRNKNYFDFFALTPLVWGWMFGCGILAVKYFNSILRWIKYFPFLIIPLIIMIIFGDGVLFKPTGNRLGFVYFICYSGLVLWFAFKLPFIRLSIDLSYGSYIWHMPIINFLLVSNISSLTLALVLTLVIATLSWYFIEKPMLKHKRKSLRPI